MEGKSISCLICFDCSKTKTNPITTGILYGFSAVQSPLLGSSVARPGWGALRWNGEQACTAEWWLLCFRAWDSWQQVAIAGHFWHP